jgi:RNA polymerase sigma-70 factor (ECF subfamily)
VTELHDEDVRDATAGIPEALSRVYTALAPQVRGYLAGHGSEDPDGVTNDVFVSVLAKLPTIHGGASGLRTFVFSVAHARLVDEHRRRARRPVLVPYDAGDDDRHSPSPAEAGIERDELQRALAELTDDQRSVLLMRVVGDLTIDQTAAALGRSAGAVKQLQRRALTVLRELYEQDEVAR